MYTDARWECKASGRRQLTYEAAMKSEQTIAAEIKGVFPSQFESIILHRIHHSKFTVDNNEGRCSRVCRPVCGVVI